MAEIKIKIGDNPGVNPSRYRDGDVFTVYNRKSIRNTHAQHICWPRAGAEGKKLGGALVNPLLEKYLEQSSKYKFTRSGSAVTRTDLTSLVEDEVGDQMDVGLYVGRRLSFKKKPMFGTPGSEIWYGGNRPSFGHTHLDAIWNQIETDTANRETSFTRYHHTVMARRNYLIIAVDDFTDAEGGVMVEPKLDVSDPENPITLARRKNQIVWRDLTGVVEADVLNVKVESDYREVRTETRSTILVTK